MFASIMRTGSWDYNRQEYLGGAGHGNSKEWKYTTNFLRDCGIDFNFNFMGLWDTVPAYGLAQNNDMKDLSDFGMDLTVSNKFNRVVHAVAVNENRYQFSRRSIYDSPEEAAAKNGEGGLAVVNPETGEPVKQNFRLEKGFLGAYSDIGGGYAEGDLSNAALAWMIKQAGDADIEFDQKVIEKGKYNEINDPIVHDSVMALPVPVGRLVYTPGSEFRWASDSSHGFDSNSIFNTYKHLGLSWNDTKMLQNPNNKKFDDVEKITRQYMKMPDANNAIYPSMIIDPVVLAQLERYRFQKESSSTGVLNNPLTSGNSILMNDNDENKIMAIRDYVTWLNCTYGLSLVTNTEKRPPTNLSKEQLCSGKPLSEFNKK